MMPIERIFPAAAGSTMVAASIPAAPPVALAVSGLAFVLVSTSLRFRGAAVPAVLAIVAALIVGHPTVLLAAVCGLAATGYLLSTAGLATLTRQSQLGAGVCTVVVAAGGLFPLEITWLPVVAPIAVIAVFALLAHPLWRDQQV